MPYVFSNSNPTATFRPGTIDLSEKETRLCTRRGAQGYVFEVPKIENISDFVPRTRSNKRTVSGHRAQFSSAFSRQIKTRKSSKFARDQYLLFFRRVFKIGNFFSPHEKRVQFHGLQAYPVNGRGRRYWVRFGHGAIRMAARSAMNTAHSGRDTEARASECTDIISW